MRIAVPAADEQAPASPTTGDDGHIGLWIALMTVSAVGAASLFLLDRKQRAFKK